jgi:hypothetical protein
MDWDWAQSLRHMPRRVETTSEGRAYNGSPSLLSTDTFDTFMVASNTGWAPGHKYGFNPIAYLTWVKVHNKAQLVKKLIDMKEGIHAVLELGRTERRFAQLWRHYHGDHNWITEKGKIVIFQKERAKLPYLVAYDCDEKTYFCSCGATGCEHIPDVIRLRSGGSRTRNNRFDTAGEEIDGCTRIYEQITWYRL